MQNDIELSPDESEPERAEGGDAGTGSAGETGTGSSGEAGTGSGGNASAHQPQRPRERLPKEEFDHIYGRVPRLTVEVVVFAPDRGVVLAVRDIPPNVGALHIPGGTVRWGELVNDAYRRVALDELGVELEAGELLGYIEYPSHFRNGLDSPVGLALLARAPLPADEQLPPGCAYHRSLPPELYAEQREFLKRRLGMQVADAQRHG